MITDRTNGIGASETKRVKGQRKIYIKGPGSPNWKGGKYKGPRAIYVYAPDHPQCDCRGYVPEHRFVAEKAFGKILPPKNIIHHIDRNPFNNLPNNLVVCEDQGYHHLLHNRMRAVEGCGDPNKRFCKPCNEWKPTEMFYLRNGYPHSGWCKNCHNKGKIKCMTEKMV